MNVLLHAASDEATASHIPELLAALGLHGWHYHLLPSLLSARSDVLKRKSQCLRSGLRSQAQGSCFGSRLGQKRCCSSAVQAIPASAECLQKASQIGEIEREALLGLAFTLDM